ncbi:thiamine-phosphate kinase, partial [Actinotalea ferrariae]
VLAHAGVRGRSAAGLALLGSGRWDDTDETAAGGLRGLVEGYRRPVSPLAAGPAAARAGATAMLDVSDGLLRDAGRLARASGVAIDVDEPRDAFADDLAALEPAARWLGSGTARADAERWVLTGGEDHGLLATFPPGTTLPPPFRACGRVRDDESGTAGQVTVAGRRPTGSTGWDHFGG